MSGPPVVTTMPTAADEYTRLRSYGTPTGPREVARAVVARSSAGGSAVHSERPRCVESGT